MAKGKLLFSLILAGVGLLIIIDSYKLGLQTLSNPGPGLFPFLLGILLCLLVFPKCIGCLKDLMKIDLVKGKKGIEYKGNLNRFIGAIICLIGYFLLLDILGFLIDTFLFLFGLFGIGKHGKHRKWLAVFLLSAVVDALAYLIFHILLQISFPSGFLRIG